MKYDSHLSFETYTACAQKIVHTTFESIVYGKNIQKTKQEDVFSISLSRMK